MFLSCIAVILYHQIETSDFPPRFGFRPL